jgi:hypothetical protein
LNKTPTQKNLCHLRCVKNIVDDTDFILTTEDTEITERKRKKRKERGNRRKAEVFLKKYI